MNFMEKTIASHCLSCLTVKEASNFMAGEKNYFDAKRMAEKTSRFEMRDILVADKDYVYPTLENFKRSFDKWLALQKHDVRHLNSLYDMRNATWEKVYDVLDEWEVFAELPKNKYVAEAINHKRKEYFALLDLKNRITKAMSRARSRISRAHSKGEDLK